MKRAVLILFALVLVAVIVIVWRGAPRGWQPTTRGTFIACTDTNGVAPGTNALFRFTEIPPESSSWYVREISQFDGTNWQLWQPLPEPAFDWADIPANNGDTLHAVIPLRATNAPARVVMQLKRNNGPYADLWRLVRGWLFRSNRANQPSASFYMTNYVLFPPPR
jgi:hypothetical protein